MNASAPPLAVADRERELLRPEVAALAAGLTDPQLRTSYAVLLEGLEQGNIPGEELDRLESLLEMGLQTGRFRRQHGPLDAQVLARLYARTPRGCALATALTGVNDALAALDGHSVDRLALSAKGPGEYELSIETDQCHMAVLIGADGVRLASLELGV